MIVSFKIALITLKINYFGVLQPLFIERKSAKIYWQKHMHN